MVVARLAIIRVDLPILTHGMIYRLILSFFLSVNKFDLPIKEFAHTPFIQGIFDIFYAR
jgi:hypothetical protein